MKSTSVSFVRVVSWPSAAGRRGQQKLRSSLPRRIAGNVYVKSHVELYTINMKLNPLSMRLSDEPFFGC